MGSDHEHGSARQEDNTPGCRWSEDRWDQEDSSFSNISVFQELNQLLLHNLKELHDQLTPSGTDNGDAISAIVIAIQMIEQKCKRLKYIRRIILITNGRGEIDGDQIAEISQKIKEEGIDLTVLGVDFDDKDYEIYEDNKDAAKAENEGILASLVGACNGTFGALAQAVEELQIPRLKSVRPVPSYRKDLTLGNAEKYETALTIEVERYPRVMIRSAPSASTYVLRSEVANGIDTAQSSATVVGEAGDEENNNPLASLKTERQYEVTDEDGNKRQVPQTDLERGYEYGRTAVYVGETDKPLLNLDTKESLEIVGFIPWSNVSVHFGMLTTSLTLIV